MSIEANIREAVRTQDIVVGARQEDIGIWTVTRDILDPRLGDLGMVRMRVYAFTGPEALRAAEVKAYEIRSSFITTLGEGQRKAWDSWGWKSRDEFLKNHMKPRRRNV